MKGQWIGRYSGTNSGVAILEIDEVQGHYEGRVYVFDDDDKLPSIFGFIRTADKADSFKVDVPLGPLHPVNFDVSDWPTIRQWYPDAQFPSTAKTKWEVVDAAVSVEWETNIGTTGKALLQKSNANRRSDLKPLDINSWDEFRRYFRDQEPYRYIYRGQENNRWRLQTSFHRTERSDLLRYMMLDVPALHQNLSSLTSHFFDLNHPVHNGAFLSLLQHHGYPTPLLDWTFSPFIAAYFAFKKAKRSGRFSEPSKVRIFMFDADQWRSDWTQLQKIAPARPHFSLFQAAAVNNSRMVPQQALSSVTNMEDIEEYIASMEKNKGKAYLQAVDLPINERLTVLKELSAMGIASGSLFPGLDGACGQLKDRFFGFD